MAKKRKTRRQKIIAATRRNVLANAIDISAPTAVSLPSHGPLAPLSPPPKTYTYVLQDARKTLFTIMVITVLNIVLFLVLKFKIVSLFGLVF